MSLDPAALQQILLKSGSIKPEELNKWAEEAKSNKRDLGSVLVEEKLLTLEQLGGILAKYFQVPFVDLIDKDIDQEALEQIPPEVAKRRRVICFRSDPKEGLSIATDDPQANRLFVQLLAKKNGKQAQILYTTGASIDQALTHYTVNFQKYFERFLRDDDSFVIRTTVHDPPVKKLVDQLVEVAHDQNASDIHIEPREDDFLVRFRIDGMLHDIFTLPKYLLDRVVTRIKVLSRLRTDQHLAAQDGKMTMMINDDRLDLRISIIPVAEGEKVVARLLTSKARSYSLEDLGFGEKDLERITNAYKQSYGMILTTGPTGSGKTTSMYSVLKLVNTRELNITSIEDPIEYRLPGANQVQVNVKTNLTFADGLRSLLRQDPDVIFVGEIRDNETASIAVNAALTGHLVLSTLHTNNAATTLPRLFDMEVEPFLVASTVRVIIGQRLVRKICAHCQEEERLSAADLAKRLFIDKMPANIDVKTGKVSVFKGKGCRFCHQTGYLGRIGIYEVLSISKTIRDLVTKRADSDQIHEQAVKEGMTTMFEDGVQKVLQGMTTIEEVLRVTRTDEIK
ncbi:Flp pilus assembly complex ATPase component TadA [Candidatus Woesebacteria bacterium]|nr:Flp pilus assembly complex ATPase component TadA [Candidatus Woesebacteria bacterium]